MQPSVFNFNGQNVRTIQVNGVPYWGAADVCSILGYANATDAIKRHCRPGGVAKHDLIDAIGRPQATTIINEGNLWRLVAKSNMPNAEAFEAWIFDEVLPAIRKTGTYVAPGAPARDAVTELDRLAAMMTTFLPALSGRVLAIEEVAERAAASASQSAQAVAAQEAKLEAIADQLADRDLLKRQQYRQGVESIKAQVFKAMTARGVSVSKVAHDFWEAVKGRAGVSSVKVESLTVSMAERLYVEAQRQARIWGVGIVVNLPLDHDEAAASHLRTVRS